jgi:virginiamycin B lyase
MQITEYLLPNPQARPRRIAIDANDIVWYTDYRRGYLGRLDPQTKQVKEYPSPGGTDSQPYGITTTADGAIWYSESGVEPNTLVRFDPGTEKFQKWNIPSGCGVVRHMVTAPNGELLLAYSGINKVGRVRIRQELLVGNPAGRIAHSFVEVIHFVDGCADFFGKSVPAVE